jgi:hypothetical protein
MLQEGPSGPKRAYKVTVRVNASRTSRHECRSTGGGIRDRRAQQISYHQQ